MEALATRELEAKIAVGETYEVSQERSLIHNSWRTSKWKTTLSWQCCAGLLTPLHCIPCICWTFLSHGKFFVDSSAFWFLLGLIFCLFCLWVDWFPNVCIRIMSTRLDVCPHPTRPFPPPSLNRKEQNAFYLSVSSVSQSLFFCVTPGDVQWFCLCGSYWLSDTPGS